MSTTPSSAPENVASALEERGWALEALSGMGYGVIIADEARRIVYQNASAVRLVGEGKLLSDPESWTASCGVFLPDERTRFDPGELPIVRALAGQPSHDVGLFVRSSLFPDGIHILCNGSPLRDDVGRVRGATVVFHDITVHRTQQARLLEGERQRRAILDNIPDIAWLKDRGGRFLAVNTPMAKAAGRAHPDELLGMTDLDLWPQDLALRYRADDEEVMRSRRPKRVEEPLVDPAGENRWIETFKTSIVGDGGEVIGTTGIARDVTERKLAEQALRYAHDELERHVALRTAELAEAQEALVRQERLAILGQLAGGVAHQIRNPLAAIMNASYVLKRHLQPEQHPDIADAIGIIHDEVRHANVIITGLLDYARVRTPDRHPASVVEIVEGVLAANWIPANIIVTRALEETPPLALDTDQLHSAVFNVVRNAVEAMPDGGQLHVEVHGKGDHVVVGFTDTGPGIASQVRAHLFEPLQSTKPMGVGLGLVTARTLVEGHGGRILHVETPTGARFEIRLPLPPPPRESTTAQT